ncbi:glycosyltransferase family 2 protein [Schwartzia succinivorans]|jgi:glycosyltransferase involved in cell wall biosynthesis|uniref:Glycosyl transferase family 2 n=1 Tax=Schwartzia succinivorans DSM 10502 TaxID=1123243 RepID=A0A1M4XNS3_9FIRM|nr:glycosyltransferase family 2 protein [Schwartzia succinivorans]SHE95105.1 Glycosyl transferase family 2 [Schwartzia succinivorans DSM 10502]
MHPKISIITVTLNSEKTLEQTISSVVNQTYDNIEYIIIDGGSTDGTLDIIHKYEKNIAYLISEPDHGIYEAFNKGVRAATGDYIEIIGSDDCLCNYDIIRQVAECLDGNIDILSCCQWAVEENTGYQRLLTNYSARNKRTYVGGMIPHGSMFVKKEVLEKYPFDESYKISADYKFFLSAYYDSNILIKYSDIAVLFFSANGISSNIAVCEEDKRIVKELRLPDSFAKDNRSVWKKNVRAILGEMGIYSIIKKIKDRLVLERHQCNNRICRWCGRGV